MIVDVSLNTISKKIVVDIDNTGGADIKGVYVDTQRTFVCNNEYSTIATKRENLETDCAVVEFDLNNINNGALATADINNDLFFVYIQLQGSSNLTMRIVYDKQNLYNIVLDSIYNEAVKSCNCNTNYIDSINKLIFLKGFELAESGTEKVYYWNMLHRGNITSIGNNCNCP